MCALRSLAWVAADPDSQDLWKLKEQVLICERELLRVLGFDLSVEHAYRCAQRRPDEASTVP